MVDTGCNFEFGAEYDDYRNHLEKLWSAAKENNESLTSTRNKILYAGKENEEGLNKFLNTAEDVLGWPKMNSTEWNFFASRWMDIQENSEPVDIPKEVDVNAVDLTLSKLSGSAWQTYRHHLLHDEGFSESSVNIIQNSTKRILNHLNIGNSSTGKTIKGLVVGNVQSGKTANMCGLVSAAADHGVNLFIVLTGTIENLRVQTRDRFTNDLRGGNNIDWDTILRPDEERRLSSLDLSKDSKKRYVICCLKQANRLAALLQWLNSDRKQKKNLRILLIDDEADQAGVNSKSMKNDPENRSIINKLMMDIVNNTNNVSKYRNRQIKVYTDIPYGAMNYVAYTATPYANVLNESGPESLYPRDFITGLIASDLYLGPQQIFGETVNNKNAGMPIINEICGDNRRGKEEASGDLALLDEVCAGETGELPHSLHEAIAWFYCAAAARRLALTRKLTTSDSTKLDPEKVHPVSMLIHHNRQTNTHEALGRAIMSWIRSFDVDEFVVFCQDVYKKQQENLSVKEFKECVPDYGKFENIEVNDYPRFEDIIPYLRELKEKIDSIEIDGFNKKFHKGIHFCIDNSKITDEFFKDESVDDFCYEDDESKKNVRLVYPDKGDHVESEAPAFIILGGDTLSRGLTLKGLICTYFAREVRQGDSLMQMGRWFGFRQGYEILCRIWMTGIAQKRFEQLSDIDMAMREDMEKYRAGISPDSTGLLIRTTPGNTYMQLVAKNKSQAAKAAEVNFAGANVQTTNFENIRELLEQNLGLADNFITSLGNPSDKESNEAHKVWKNVQFEEIWNKLLKDGNWHIGRMEDLDQFKQWYDQISEKEDGGFTGWNVVLSGTKNGKKWHGIGKIKRSRKISGMNREDSVAMNLGVISSPEDWHADIAVTKEQIMKDLQEFEDNGVKAGEPAKAEVRKKYGLDKTPLLVVYCIDKDSGVQKDDSAGHRAPLNAEADIIGLYMRIPGQRINKDYVAYITVDLPEPMDEEEA